ncbi:hypothetical protein HGE68_06825 [Rhodobacteraceae bacterium R_SAG6]|nr:hypothetical protein [Rhodobacteraceae bacterium R_SAG6]
MAKAAPKVDSRVSELINAMISHEPSFGYHTVAWLLVFTSHHFTAIVRSYGLKQEFIT